MKQAHHLINELRRLSETVVRISRLRMSYSMRPTSASQNLRLNQRRLRRRAKFPPAMALEFLLRTHERTGNRDALEMVRHTLNRWRMAECTINWAAAFTATQPTPNGSYLTLKRCSTTTRCSRDCIFITFKSAENESARETVEGILDYVLREMTTLAGGFYSNAGRRLRRS